MLYTDCAPNEKEGELKLTQTFFATQRMKFSLYKSSPKSHNDIALSDEKIRELISQSITKQCEDNLVRLLEQSMDSMTRILFDGK